MLFNSIVFIVFLIFVVTTNYLLPSKWRKYFLVSAGYVFYGYWDWRFCGLLLLSTIVDFYLGQAIAKADNIISKKRFLSLSIFLNLSLLGFFKYFNFFIDTFQSSFGASLDFLHLNLILPVGISFYTFQSLSYIFDIYRGKCNSCNSLLDYATFVAFFPQLMAGPIERAVNLLPQIERMKSPSKIDFKKGLALLTLGMFKKVLIGDTIGKYVDHIFTEPQWYYSDELIIALFMFSIQIYVDFSGYSLIAKGSAKFLGVDLIDNFKRPYLSINITDFWRRWHISLSNWLKEYVYIWWLGGNRINKWRTYLNLFYTMLLGGIWHGANWTFVIWGGIHGLALAFHKKFGSKGKVEISKWDLMLRFSSGVFTFIFVSFAWLFFRAENFETVKLFMTSISEWRFGADSFLFLKIFTAYAMVVLFLDILEEYYNDSAFLSRFSNSVFFAILIPSWFSIILYLYTVGRPSPFIYFQF
jgi:alginate O-acetyltransferase complex protein AlgI